MSERIRPDVWRVGGGSWNGTVTALSFEDDANVYVLRGPDGAVLVDCGHLAGRAAIERNVRATGVEPAELGELLLTHSHWDQRRRRAPGSPSTGCARTSTRAARSSSRAATCASSARRCAGRATGDVAFGPKGGGLRALGFLCALWLSNLDDYVASLRRLAALRLDLLLPGHGAPVQGRDAVRAAIDAASETAEAYAADASLRDNFGV